ncbi:MAG: hypothetical protein LBL66_04950, partial [Clostridiales bacterium]|nr:hypothetical protein [Clostridiales bacterium]
IARSAKRPLCHCEERGSATRQSLYKKTRFVFCRDCRVALRAPRNGLAVFIFNAVCTLPCVRVTAVGRANFFDRH